MLDEFLKSQVFLRLGNSINKGQWQSAVMTISRMQNTLHEIGFKDWDRNLMMLRMCVIKKDRVAAQNALAMIVSKRVALLNKGEKP